MLEPHGHLVDGLTQAMQADEDAPFGIDGAMRVADLRAILRTHYDWAIGRDYDRPDQCARFWYISEEKLEPRLGERAQDAGAAREQPLCIARLAADLARTTTDYAGNVPVATLLLAHPEHRLMVRRAQMAAHHPYGEIRDNLIDAAMLPIDLLRCKLSFFGASRFDPRSDRWVRISLFQGAPYPDDLNRRDAS